MRALGASLGVEAMSLYRHVANKSALLDGLHEHVLSRIALPEPDPAGEWRPAARALGYAFRDVLREHPAAIPLFLTRAAVTAGSLRYLEAGLTVLAGAGFEPRPALATFQAMYALIVGHCAFHYGAAADEDPEYADLDGARFPHVLALADLTDYSAEYELEIALEALLRGARVS